jgi:site-specific DNA recombinase
MYAGYVRVSRVGDRRETLKSPEDQEREIRRWAKTSGNNVEILPAELDRSGADDDRPILLGAIERIEAGELAGIVVCRLDRFTRSLASSVRMIERIEKAGGKVISATEPVDNGSDLLRNITLSIAQDERDRRAEDFERSKAAAIRAGIYVGRAPLGYLKGEDRRLAPDPDVAPVVREAFQRRAAGESWSGLATFMAERLDRGMLPASVRVMIQNPAYTGVARQGTHQNPNAHEPIVDRATFEAAQLDHPRPPRGKHGTGLLVGIVRCAGCSKRMTSTVGEKGRVYRCRRRHAGGECPEPASIGAYIEPYVTAAVFAHLKEGKITYTQRTDALATAQTALDEAERRRDELHKALDIADVGAENFAAAMRDVVGDVERCKRELAEAHLAAAPAPQHTDVADVLDELDRDELRRVLGGALGVVWVRRGRADIGRRVRMIATGFEPRDLSGRGVPSGPPVSVDLPEGDVNGEIRPASGEDLD